MPSPTLDERIRTFTTPIVRKIASCGSTLQLFVLFLLPLAAVMMAVLFALQLIAIGATSLVKRSEPRNVSLHDYPDYELEQSWTPHRTVLPPKLTSSVANFRSTPSADFGAINTPLNRGGARLVEPTPRRIEPARPSRNRYPVQNQLKQFPILNPSGYEPNRWGNEDRNEDQYESGGRRQMPEFGMPEYNNLKYSRTSQVRSRFASAMGYSYAGYIMRQSKRYPIMMYTLVACLPCQRAKHLLAVSYSDVAAHFLELVGDESWQRQLQVDLQQMTGQITFPYIFVCGQHIGGASDLFGLHQSGQLRSTLNNCAPPLQ